MNDAIANFVQENGYYPCPAAPTDAGAVAGDCSDTAQPVGARDAVTGVARANTAVAGQVVRIGVVPTTVMVGGQARQLISAERAVDGWRNRLTYAVIEGMAVPAADLSVDGSIVINPNGGGAAIDDRARFVVLSHGQDGVGAYTTSGALRRDCGAGSDDDENCDVNATFTSIGIGGTRSTTGGANNFDDFVMGDGQRAEVRCNDGEEMRGFNLHTRQPICVGRDLNCGANEAFVGLITNPDGSVRANCRNYTTACAGGQVLVETGDDATKKCMAVSNVTGACGAGHIQVGTEGYDATSGTMGKPKCLKIENRCGDGYVQVGVGEDLQPKCFKIAKGCADNQVQVGVGEDLQPMCAPSAGVCGEGQMQVGIKDGATRSPECAPVPRCPTGQYITGTNDGKLTCSVAVGDGECEKGEVVTGIEGGKVKCDQISVGNKVSLCNERGLAYRPDDPSRDADGCALVRGVTTGSCSQGWGAVDHPSISSTEAPAYFDWTPRTCEFLSPWAPIDGCHVGCSCPPGYAAQWTGTCNFGDCTDPAKGGSVTEQVFFYTCRKL